MNALPFGLDGIETVGAAIHDDFGRVLHHEGRILRVIYAGKEQFARELLASGLVDELVADGVFPRTTVAEFASEQYPLVLEHERVAHVTYPFEWSFAMFRDAALVTLHVNRAANRYGYEIKDSHAMNVVFTPRGATFVDLGSFVKKDDPTRGWRTYEEFVRNFVSPLRLWRLGNESIMRRLLVGPPTPSMPVAFALCLHPWLRWLPLRLTEDLLESGRLYRALWLVSDERIRQRLPAPIGQWLCALRNAKLLPAGQLSLAQLEHQVKGMVRRAPSPARRARLDRGRPPEASCQRDARVIALVESLKPVSVLDLAGGDGERAEAVSKLPGVQVVICNDIDDHAIDRCYERSQAAGRSVLSSVFDFVYPLRHPFFPLPHERLAADVVIALDLTRQMLFTKRLQVDGWLKTIAAFVKDYVIVEFVPLSAQDPLEAAPWYHRDWFEGHFRACFELTYVEPLEDGRVLFVGRNRSSAGEHNA